MNSLAKINTFKRQFIKNTDSQISRVMDIVEMSVDSDSKRNIVRRVLLRAFNDIKREALTGMQGLETHPSNTSPVGVAVVAPEHPSQGPRPCEKFS